MTFEISRQNNDAQIADRRNEALRGDGDLSLAKQLLRTSA